MYELKHLSLSYRTSWFRLKGLVCSGLNEALIEGILRDYCSIVIHTVLFSNIPSGSGSSPASHWCFGLLLANLEGLLRSHRHDNQSSCRSPFQVSELFTTPSRSFFCQIKQIIPHDPLCVFRREREKTGFSFCLESEWAGGQRVDKAGKGLLQVWKRQIQQLNRVSPDMASTILAAYPSPQLLKKVHSLQTH